MAVTGTSLMKFGQWAWRGTNQVDPRPDGLWVISDTVVGDGTGGTLNVIVRLTLREFSQKLFNFEHMSFDVGALTAVVGGNPRIDMIHTGVRGEQGFPTLPYAPETTDVFGTNNVMRGTTSWARSIIGGGQQMPASFGAPDALLTVAQYVWGTNANLIGYQVFAAGYWWDAGRLKRAQVGPQLP